MMGEQIISRNAPDLLDFEFIGSLEAAIGAQPCRQLIEAFVRDCRASARRLSDTGAGMGRGMGSPAMARDAHRFAGMLAQFGCPAAAAAFRAASHAPTDEMPRLIALAIALVEPTCRAMEALLAKKAA